MVLGHHPKSFKHMMKNIVSSLIKHERIVTTNAKAKWVLKATNKLIHFAKKADKGFTSPLNLLKGRVTTEKVYKKLMMQIVPKLQHMPQNYVSISRSIHYRRGDNAPMRVVTIKGTQKEEAVCMRARQRKANQNSFDTTAYSRKLLAEEKAYYEKIIKEHPEKADFLKSKLARIQFEQWTLDKKHGDKKIAMLI